MSQSSLVHSASHQLEALSTGAAFQNLLVFKPAASPYASSLFFSHNPIHSIRMVQSKTSRFETHNQQLANTSLLTQSGSKFEEEPPLASCPSLPQTRDLLNSRSGWPQIKHLDSRLVIVLLPSAEPKRPSGRPIQHCPFTFPPPFARRSNNKQRRANDFPLN